VITSRENDLYSTNAQPSLDPQLVDILALYRPTFDQMPVDISVDIVSSDATHSKHKLLADF